MKSEISTLSFGTLMLLSGGNLAYSFLQTVNYTSKRNIAEDKIATLEEQYGIEPKGNLRKKRTRGR